MLQVNGSVVSTARARAASAHPRRKADFAQVYFNGRFLVQPQTGVQRYATETLLAIDELLANGHAASKHRFHLLAPPGAKLPTLRVIEARHVGPLDGHLWEQATFPFAGRKGLLWSFSATGPFAIKNQGITLHDGLVRAMPETFSWKFRALHSLALPWLVRRSAQVMTVSEFSRSELARHFGANFAALRVSGEGWQHVGRNAADHSILATHQLVPGRYVLAVSSITPHKNFAVVERALAQLTGTDYQFVIAGMLDEKVFGALPSSSLQRVKRVGFVSDAQLRALYESAGVFVYPSLYEGFGLPPLEAMACGCPVIASDTAALPESCGEGALYFDPHDEHQLANLIERIMSDEAERHALIERGRAELSRHSWRVAARVHLTAINATLARLDLAAIEPMESRMASPHGLATIAARGESGVGASY